MGSSGRVGGVEQAMAALCISSVFVFVCVSVFVCVVYLWWLPNGQNGSRIPNTNQPAFQ